MSIFYLYDWDYYLWKNWFEKQIHRGGKLKERLNQKYPLIKSEDPPFFSTCYKKSLIRLNLLIKIAYKVNIIAI